MEEEKTREYYIDRLLKKVVKSGVEISIKSYGLEFPEMGKGIYVKWEIILRKNNKIIKIHRLGGLYEIRKALDEALSMAERDIWYELKN